ncbi:MAG: ATP-dependent Clp protease adapter ClpS [Micrococcus sp.]|nr:ATP-dependent Clp protease adapter ClpS [Micrococcus sp.]
MAKHPWGVIRVPVASAQPEGDVAVLDRAEQAPVADSGWNVVVWDDPVNLMSYVAYVFRSHFGYSAETAHRLMLRVHESGRAVVAQGNRETGERHVAAMHGFGLWATLEQDED